MNPLAVVCQENCPNNHSYYYSLPVQELLQSSLELIVALLHT